MWLLKHWKAAVGLLTLIPPICKAFWEAVGIAGNLDFLITHAHDLGWMGDVIGWLLNPPGWAILPLIAVGLSLIWWDTWRNRPATSGPFSAIHPRDAMPIPPKVAEIANRAQSSSPSIAESVDVDAAQVVTFSPWAKYSEIDLQRLEAAIYAMHQILADCYAGFYQDARFLTGNFESSYNSKKDHYILELSRFRDEIVILIKRLHDIQYREFSFYADVVRGVYDNLGFSSMLGAVDRFKHLLECSPPNAPRALIDVIAKEKDAYESAVTEFGSWITKSMNKTKEMQNAVVAEQQSRRHSL